MCVIKLIAFVSQFITLKDIWSFKEFQECINDIVSSWLIKADYFFSIEINYTLIYRR